MSLSPYEQRILDEIESDLGRKDPALAATFATTRPASTFRQWFPISAAHAFVLVLLLVLLVVAHPVALVLGPVGPGVLTWAVIVPWLVSATRARTRRRSGRS